MNIEREQERFIFVCNRDGIEKAVEWAAFISNVYRQALKQLKEKHGRRARYRREWLQSARSLQRLHREWRDVHKIEFENNPQWKKLELL